jgi:WD40 repeat protein
MQSGDCIYTIEAHRSFVTCLEVSCPSSSSKQLVSGSYDGSIKIWNSQTNECLKTIGRSNDNSYVHCIRINQFSKYK